MIDIGAVLGEALAWLKLVEDRTGRGRPIDPNQTALAKMIADLGQAIKVVGNDYKMATFGDLYVGDHFIAWPTPGDNSGHGGFLKGMYLHVKIGLDTYVDGRGVASTAPRTMKVIKVVL